VGAPRWGPSAALGQQLALRRDDERHDFEGVVHVPQLLRQGGAEEQRKPGQRLKVLALVIATERELLSKRR
jgi:hypothetical protein